jgi:uncharacterized protein with HEPN domain
MTDRQSLYLHQMRMAASDIGDFVDGMDRDAFLNDVLVQRAVGMSILMIGEAVIRLVREYPEFPSDHPELPWSEIQGLRNRIAHGYFDIDMNIVWETARHSIPEFLNKLQALESWRAQGE